MDFFKVTVISKLKQLTPNQKPLWGIMTPQHMVEHLVGSWRISNGRVQLPEKPVDESKKAFLYNNMPYPKNIQNAALGNGLAPLRKTDLQAAILQLNDEINAFFNYHDENPTAIFFHPAYGNLNKNEWLLFQKKHCTHHLTQFNLL